jgi:hypothetical protein
MSKLGSRRRFARTLCAVMPGCRNPRRADVVAAWSAAEVADWLQSIGMGKYAKAFAKHEVRATRATAERTHPRDRHRHRRRALPPNLALRARSRDAHPDAHAPGRTPPRTLTRTRTRTPTRTGGRTHAAGHLGGGAQDRARRRRDRPAQALPHAALQAGQGVLPKACARARAPRGPRVRLRACTLDISTSLARSRSLALASLSLRA